MDALKAEIASKRKALEEVPARPNKYMRRGDLERLKEEEERKAREKQAEERERLEKEKAEQAAAASASKSKPGLASKVCVSYFYLPFVIFVGEDAKKRNGEAEMLLEPGLFSLVDGFTAPGWLSRSF